MNQIIAIDYGRSTVKGARGLDNNDTLIIPNSLSWDNKGINKKLDLTNVDKIKENPLDYLKVKIDGVEFIVGKLANDSEYVIHPSNFDIEEDEDTKKIILAALSYLVSHDGENECPNINLALTLSADQYQLKKDSFAKVYKNKSFAVEFYDHDHNNYHKKEFYVDNVLVKQQGFFAFMHSVLNNEGKIIDDKENIFSNTIGVIDIGHYSTDLFVCDNLDPVPIKNVETKIPGMDKAFSDIMTSLEEEHGILPKEHKIRRLLEKGRRITKSGRKINDIEIVNKHFDVLARIISSQILNKLTISIKEIDNLFVCGGGAKSEYLRNKISEYTKRKLKIIEEPRMANALGALKLARRSF